MHITLICRHSHGSVSFPEGLIEGHHAPERRYAIHDHHVTLDGHSDIILHHDAEKLLAMPGGLYRMPTPAEQTSLVEAKHEASTVQEDVPHAKRTKG